jgi:hypothetical protein
MPIDFPVSAVVTTGGATSVTTGGGVVTTGNKHPGAGAWAATAAALVAMDFAAAAAAAAVLAQSAVREEELPSALSETSGSSVALTGAAYTAWLEIIAAKPVAKIAVRILDVIDLPRSADMALNRSRMDVTPHEAFGCACFFWRAEVAF